MLFAGQASLTDDLVQCPSLTFIFNSVPTLLKMTQGLHHAAQHEQKAPGLRLPRLQRLSLRELSPLVAQTFLSKTYCP